MIKSLLVIGSAFLVTTPLIAQPPDRILALSWQFDAIDSLFAINVATGAATPVGFPESRTNSLAQDEQGYLYTVRQPLTAAEDSPLFRIDPQTGASLVVAILDNSDIRGLAWSPVDELFYAMEANGDSIGPSELVRIDLDGRITSIENLTIRCHSLAFSETGILYCYDLDGLGLVSINEVTGQVVDLDPSVGTEHGILALMVMADGTMLAASQPDLFELDPATGSATLLTSFGVPSRDVRGIAEVASPATPREIPTLSDASTALLSLLLAAVAVWFLRHGTRIG